MRLPGGSSLPRLGVVAAVAAIVATGTVDVAAATDPSGARAPAAAPGISLVDQPAWIPVGGAEIMSLHLDDRALASDPDAAVEVTVHSSVTSRNGFNDAVTGADLGGTLSRLTFPLSEVQRNRRGNFLVGYGLSGSGASQRIGVDSPGVYPVEVGIVGTQAEHRPFVTWMVVIDPEAAKAFQPLRVAWIWQLASPPVERPTGGLNQGRLAPMRPGGRLDRISKLLARAGSFPLTLAIGPEMLKGWAAGARADPALSAGVERVRQAAARRTTQLLPEPYVPIAGPVLEAEELGGHLPDEFVAGSNTVDEATGEIPDPRTAFVDPVDDPTVARLTQMLVGRFVVRDTALVPVAESRTPAQPFVLTTSIGSAPAAATDGGIELLLAGSGTPALRAQRVMAALAEIAYEAPSQARGVVLAMPTDWAPDGASVADLLDNLPHDPLVRPATLDTFFQDVSPAETDGVQLQRRLASLPPNDVLPLAPRDYEGAQRELTAYAAMVGRNDPTVAAGQRELLLALSSDNTPKEAEAYLAAIGGRLDALTAGISTTAKTLTLTARRASLPLSFINNTGRADLRVRVHLDSPKLIFPKGHDVVMTLPLGHSTAARGQFPVIARASGTFAMTVTLESADGSLPLGAPTRVTIRSAVFSGIGIALTVGALVFLAGWWGNHFWRTRRARRRALAA